MKEKNNITNFFKKVKILNKIDISKLHKLY